MRWTSCHRDLLELCFPNLVAHLCCCEDELSDVQKNKHLIFLFFHALHEVLQKIQLLSCKQPMGNPSKQGCHVLLVRWQAVQSPDRSLVNLVVIWKDDRVLCFVFCLVLPFLSGNLPNNFSGSRQALRYKYHLTAQWAYLLFWPNNAECDFPD